MHAAAEAMQCSDAGSGDRTLPAPTSWGWSLMAWGSGLLKQGPWLTLACERVALSPVLAPERSHSKAQGTPNLDLSQLHYYIVTGALAPKTERCPSEGSPR